MKDLEIGLFFGAGAEIAYGLPSGGKFALEIFRRSPDPEKQKLRSLISQIDKTSPYANTFLPHSFEAKRLSSFGKGDYKALLKSSIEYKRRDIIAFLDHFDRNAEGVIKGWVLDEDQVKAKFLEATGKELGAVIYDQEIKLNDSLHAESKLFVSEYFSGMLEILKKNPKHRLLKRSLSSFLQLMVGCYGQELASELNEQVFEKAPEDIPIFDDVAGFLHIEISQAGLTALELILDEDPQDIAQDSDCVEVFAELSRAVLRLLIEKCLDYQSLIDSHFRYLYEPKVHWGNFTKIVTFLNVVRSYITADVTPDLEVIKDQPGYYGDLREFEALGLRLGRIGTTNYNPLIPLVAGEEVGKLVEHLNGSVKDYYDPYLNKIVHLERDEDYVTHPRILVPFLFTQSGIKPLTSVEMSSRYVRLYESFRKADAVIVTGYGFNRDDGHINGLFRELVEEDKKNVFILHYTQSDANQNALNREYRKKLRTTRNLPNLHIVPIDNDRSTRKGLLWYQDIAQMLRN